MPLLLPIDDQGKVISLTPNVLALAVTVDDTISSATDITLNTNTQ